MVICCLRWVDHLKCTFVWLFPVLGECRQPKKLIPEGQGILAFAYLSIKNKMAAGSDFYCCGPLIFARQKLVCYCGMFSHVLFEVRGITTWVTASCTLVWFCSSANAEVRFKISCLGKWPTTLFTWSLSTVGKQMPTEIWFCDWGVLAPVALIWLLCLNVFECVFYDFLLLNMHNRIVWRLFTVGEYMWLFRFPAQPKEPPHSAHLCTFSPVWVIMCILLH